MLDVIDCKNVIIYDMPDSIEDYVHRSGRTGRFGTEGLCTAFLTYECTIARELRRLLRDSDQPIPKGRLKTVSIVLTHAQNWKTAEYLVDK